MISIFTVVVKSNEKEGTLDAETLMDPSATPEDYHYAAITLLNMAAKQSDKGVEKYLEDICQEVLQIDPYEEVEDEDEF